jgi:GTP-binding protein Era
MIPFVSGFISISGRTNVGKSTFLNAVIGEKIAITTFRPQTTRNRIIGVKNYADAQLIFLDTPGIHRPRHKLGEMMVKTSLNALAEVDVIFFMVEPCHATEEDMFIINNLKNLDKPVFLLINKIDTIKKYEILPVIDEYRKLYSFEEIIPISALKGEGIEESITIVKKFLPQGPRYYPENIVTDQLERFMVSEIIREKVMLATEQEIPYSVAVEVNQWNERSRDRTKESLPVIFIGAHIYVERKSQKSIIIGKKGSKLKQIGMQSRKDIEKLLNAKIYLDLRVKVQERWRADLKILKEMGFN